MLAYVGVLTGAGLASGQELMQYFVSLGIPGLIGMGVVAILHIIIGGVLLVLGSHYLASDHSDVFNEITNKFISKFMDLAIIFTCFVIGFVMLAGAGSNLEEAFGFNVNVGRVLCAVLIIVVGMLDFDKVSQIIGSFTPFIVVLSLIGGVYTFINYDINWQDLSDFAIANVPGTFESAPLSVFNYFGMSLMTAVSMGLVLGGDEMSSDDAGKGGLFGGAIAGIMGIIISLTLFIRIKEVYTLDIPMLEVIRGINGPLGVLMALIIFGMVFNTGISLFYALARRFSKGDVKKFRVMLIGITLAGFVVSFAGFKELVNMFYPIIGYVGIFMMFVLVYAYFKERSSIRHESLKRVGIRHYMRKKLDEDEEFSVQDEVRLNKLIERSHIDNKDLTEKAEETVKEEIESEEVDIDELKEEISDLKEEIRNLKSEVEDLKEE